MAKCNMCGEVLEEGKGKMFVKKDGKLLYFCSRKCEKNMIQLKRKPLSMKWSKLYQK